VPFDLDANKIPDTKAQMLTYLATARTLNALNPMMVDEDGDGDFLDHYLGKPTPDWNGSVGMNMTLRRNWRFSTLFEYKAGHYTITNLTDGFRKANASIGRNTFGAAQVEAAVENPASTAEQRLDAALLWANKYKALSPYDGMNQNEHGDFVRWREISLTYQAPDKLAGRLGARDMSLSLTGRNLMLWTRYSGVDNETNVFGRSSTGGIDNNFGDAIEAFGFPIPRRVSLSVRLGY
jgi:TonB-dependent starch-binding outer membrane protein SusC